MDAQRRTRKLNRERSSRPSQEARGAKQICIPMEPDEYDRLWHDPQQLRQYLEKLIVAFPELFPPGIEQGFQLTGACANHESYRGSGSGNCDWPTDRSTPCDPASC